MGYDCIMEIRQTTHEMMSAKKETQLERAMKSREDLSDILVYNLRPVTSNNVRTW